MNFTLKTPQPQMPIPVQVLVPVQMQLQTQPEPAKADLRPLIEFIESIEFDKIPTAVKVGAFAWGALGFYRGIRYRSWKYRQELLKYEKLLERKKHAKKPEQFYVATIAFGLLSSFVYHVPIANLFYLSKELWRLEVWLRGLDEDTESESYNTLY